MSIIKQTSNNTFTHVEIHSINGDGSLSIDFLTMDENGDITARENNYVMPAPLPFELTAEEIEALSPKVLNNFTY